jgi:hypothetical protein
VQRRERRLKGREFLNTFCEERVEASKMKRFRANEEKRLVGKITFVLNESE